MRKKEERDPPEVRYGRIWFRKPGWLWSGRSDITTENEHHKATFKQNGCFTEPTQ